MSIAQGDPHPLAVRTVPIADPGSLIARLPDSTALAWIHGDEGLIGWGEAVRIPVGTGPDRLSRAEAELHRVLSKAQVSDSVRVPGTGAVAFGSFTFDPGDESSVLVLPRVVIGRRDGHAWMTTIGGGENLTPLRPVASPADVHWGDGALSPPAWMRAVQRAVTEVRAGRVDKIVLSRDVFARAAGPLDPRTLLERLAGRYPDCYVFSCAGLVGATPELLIRREGDRVTSLVLAGSSARGSTDREDKELGAALLASDKDVAEHQFAVDSVRCALAPRCAELAVDEQPSLLSLANVHHLATTVSGLLAGEASSLEVAGALHPTAAVCGTPAPTAMQLIRELEGMRRGRYAGPVGWLDSRGNGEWGIALRCAELNGSQARLFAGNGIVAGSDPEAELAETQVKLRAMQGALEP